MNPKSKVQLDPPDPGNYQHHQTRGDILKSLCEFQRSSVLRQQEFERQYYQALQQAEADLPQARERIKRG